MEGFPIGEDEDILNLSDPPYYTACPNPWLNDFIAECHSLIDLDLPTLDKLFTYQPFVRLNRKETLDFMDDLQEYQLRDPYFLFINN